MIKSVLLLEFVAISLAVPPPYFNTGLYSSRIVGGVEATPHEFPWQVSIQYHGSHICGGSIFNANAVITAAHCVDGVSASSISVMAGKHNLNITEATQQSIQVSAIVQHPEYPGASGFPNDIAILKLTNPSEFNNAVDLVPIAPTGHTASGEATITGWGSPQEGGSLQKVEVPIVSDAECRPAYGSSAFYDSMICAGLPEGGKDSCQGDGGGPLLAKDRGTGYYLAGIVSWGFGCGQPGYPGVYTEVSFYNDFIQANT